MMKTLNSFLFFIFYFLFFISGKLEACINSNIAMEEYLNSEKIKQGRK